MEALFMALMTALFISIRLMRPVAHDDRQEEHRPKKCAAGQLTVEHHRHKQRKDEHHRDGGQHIFQRVQQNAHIIGIAPQSVPEIFQPYEA